MPALRIVLTTFAVAAVTFLAGAAPIPPRPAVQVASTAPAAAASVEGARYTDPTYNFSLAAPAFAPAKERTVVATFQGPSEDGFASNITLVVDPGATTRDGYLEASMKQLSETNPRYAVQHLDRLQVSGRDALVLEYDFNVGGRRLRFLQLAVFAPDRVYILTCTAPVETYKDHEVAFHKCVDSFRLEK